MIVVLGSVLSRVESMHEALELSREHVLRSRQEPGCISHAVHIDTENAARLVFVEQWENRESLWQHFAVPATRSFAKRLASLAAEPTTLAIYDATPITPA